MKATAWFTLAVLGALFGCGGDNTDSEVAAAGIDESTKTKALEAGASVLQDKTPLKSLDAYLDGFHFYNGNMQVQMEAHHYCGHINEDLIQCVIFDGNARDAKLTGVEYIISKRLFAQLPVEEKYLWHSHAHEVRSGQLIAPGIPALVEHELMEKIAGTYGKTWHTWDTEQQLQLPLGIPMLMMGFTQDGQAKEQMVADRDKRFNVDSSQIRKQRADIKYPSIDEGADAWEDGRVLQLQPIDQSDQPPAASSHSHGKADVQKQRN